MRAQKQRQPKNTIELVVQLNSAKYCCRVSQFFERLAPPAASMRPAPAGQVVDCWREIYLHPRFLARAVFTFLQIFFELGPLLLLRQDFIVNRLHPGEDFLVQLLTDFDDLGVF